MNPLKNLFFLPFVLALGGCHSSQGPETSSLASDEMPKSLCANCALKPFYVNGHWVEDQE